MPTPNNRVDNTTRNDNVRRDYMSGDSYTVLKARYGISAQLIANLTKECDKEARGKPTNDPRTLRNLNPIDKPHRRAGMKLARWRESRRLDIPNATTHYGNVGVSMHRWSKMEKGLAPLTLDDLQHLADLLKDDLDLQPTLTKDDWESLSLVAKLAAELLR